MKSSAEWVTVQIMPAQGWWVKGTPKAPSKDAPWMKPLVGWALQRNPVTPFDGEVLKIVFLGSRMPPDELDQVTIFDAALPPPRWKAEMADAMRRLAAAGKKLARPGRWKPVVEQLPDDELTVLVTNAAWDEPVWMGYRDGEVWRDVNAEVLEPDPTHWMDLPAPPLEGGR